MSKTLAIGCSNYLKTTAAELLPPGTARSDVIERASLDGVFTLIRENPGIRAIVACLNSSDLRDLYHVQALRETHTDITLVALFDITSATEVVRRTVRGVLAAFAGGEEDPRTVSAAPVREPTRAEPQAQGYHLTPRQCDVLFLIREGKSNKEIARDLMLSEGTVKIHCMSIFRELDTANRTQAAMLAERFKLNPPVKPAARANGLTSDAPGAENSPAV